MHGRSYSTNVTEKIIVFDCVRQVARPLIVSQSHSYFWAVPPREQISVFVVDKVFVKDKFY